MSQKQRLKARDLHILKIYFQVMHDLGKDACTMPKAELYTLVAEKIYLCESYIAKIIRRQLCDSEAVDAAKALMNHKQ